MKTKILCESCKFFGEISEYNPSMSLYSDIRCSKCGSTNNQHNSDYHKRLDEAMKGEARAAQEFERKPQ